jgi:hypothetical protein
VCGGVVTLGVAVGLGVGLGVSPGLSVGVGRATVGATDGTVVAGPPVGVGMRGERLEAWRRALRR